MFNAKFLSIIGCFGTIATFSMAKDIETMRMPQNEELEPIPAKADPIAPKAEEPAPKNINAKSDSKPIQTAEKKVEKTQPTKEEILQYFEVLGYMQSSQYGLTADFYLTDEEIESVLKGMRIALHKQTFPYPLAQKVNEAQKYFHERQEADKIKLEDELKNKANVNRKAGEAFLKKLKADKPTVKSTSSGLHYEIVKGGDAKRATSEDSVQVTYSLQLMDGKMIEATDTPVTLPLQGVIPGIQEGLQLIGNNGEITLYIPENLAYGSKDILGIPPGSLLIFKMNVSKIISASEDKNEKVNNKAPETKNAADDQD